VAMGMPGRLAVVAVLAMAGACSGSDSEEPGAAPVVCSSDVPFLIDDPTPTRAEVLDMQAGTGLDDAGATRRGRAQNIAAGVREPLELEDPATSASGSTTRATASSTSRRRPMSPANASRR